MSFPETIDNHFDASVQCEQSFTIVTTFIGCHNAILVFCFVFQNQNIFVLLDKLDEWNKTSGAWSGCSLKLTISTVDSVV